MILLAAVVTLRLVSFHGPDGYPVEINPEQVTSLRGARESDQEGKYFTSEAHCMIGLTDGKFVTVAETCADVRKLLEGPQ